MDNALESILNKVTDIGFKSGTFKPEGSEESINYTSLVLRVISDGNVIDIPLSGANATKPSALKLMLKGVNAGEKQKTLLEDE